MDKYQAARAAYPENCPTSDNNQIIFISGWQARDAQLPSDAIAFVEWTINKTYFLSKDNSGRWVNIRGQIIAETTAELYKLFNPSGAAPQAVDRFLQGYACAVANMCRMNGEADTRTCELFREGIGKMANLKDAGIDECDMEILKKYFK